MIFNTEPSKLFEYVEKNLLNSKMKVNNPKIAYLDTFVINILQWKQAWKNIFLQFMRERIIPIWDMWV